MAEIPRYKVLDTICRGDSDMRGVSNRGLGYRGGADGHFGQCLGFCCCVEGRK